MVVTDINERELEETIQLAKKLNPLVDIKSTAGDLTVAGPPGQLIEKLIQLAKISFRRLDYAVNCAGIAGKSGPTDELNFQDFRKTQEINVDALWLCEQAELKFMKSQEPINGYLHIYNAFFSFSFPAHLYSS